MIPDLVATEQGLVWVVSRASVTLQPVLEDETPVLLVGVVGVVEVADKVDVAKFARDCFRNRRRNWFSNARTGSRCTGL